MDISGEEKKNKNQNQKCIVGGPLTLMMTPVCPRLLNMITDFVLLRFWARASEDLSAIEVILLLLFIIFSILTK